MYSYVNILDVELMNSDLLFPTPNIQEWSLIEREFLTELPLDGILRMVGHYRGQLIYLENGACVYRCKPNSVCANGLMGPPIDGMIEDVYIRHDGKFYRGFVTFKKGESRNLGLQIEV